MRRSISTILAWLVLSACASSSRSVDAGRDGTDAISDPARFHRALGRSFLEQRDYTQAARELERSLAADEDSPETHLLLGVALRERGLWEDAEASLKRAVECDDDLADAYSALGILYDRMGREGDAEGMHREALRRDPKRHEFHNNLGFSLYLRGAYTEAIRSFRAALRLGGGERSRNNLGFAYGRIGEMGRAFREFKRGGTEAEAHNNIGYVYEVRGDLARAESAYRRALTLDPGLKKARDNLDHILGSSQSRRGAEGRSPDRESVTELEGTQSGEALKMFHDGNGGGSRDADAPAKEGLMNGDGSGRDPDVDRAPERGSVEE